MRGGKIHESILDLFRQYIPFRMHKKFNEDNCYFITAETALKHFLSTNAYPDILVCINDWYFMIEIGQFKSLKWEDKDDKCVMIAVGKHGGICVIPSKYKKTSKELSWLLDELIEIIQINYKNGNLILE